MLRRVLFCASVLAASIPHSFAAPVIEHSLQERKNIFKTIWSDIEEAVDDIVDEATVS